MNTLKKALIAGSCAAFIALGTSNATAQGQGGGRGGDPAQFRQRMMDNLRDQMEVKDDAEWTALEPKLTKVFDAQREQMAGRFRGAMGGGRRGGAGGGTNDANGDNGGGRRQRGGGAFGGEPSAAVTALQKAVDDKAPKAEIQAKLKVVQAEAKANQAKLVAAQEELRSVLTTRQEAILTLRGMLQ